jgi:hypothetical protein
VRVGLRIIARRYTYVAFDLLWLDGTGRARELFELMRDH